MFTTLKFTFTTTMAETEITVQITEKEVVTSVVNNEVETNSYRYPRKGLGQWRSQFQNLKFSHWSDETQHTTSAIYQLQSWQIQYVDQLHEKQWHSVVGGSTVSMGWEDFVAWLDNVAPLFFKSRIDVIKLGYLDDRSSETLILNRNAGRLSWTSIGDGQDVWQVIHDSDAVDDLIDDIAPGNGEIADSDPQNNHGLALAFQYHHGPLIVLHQRTRILDWGDDWSAFGADLVDLFQTTPTFPDRLFNQQPVIKPPHQAVYMVMFPESGAIAEYRAAPEQFAIGDAVLVPVGISKRITQAVVQRIYAKPFADTFMKLRKVIGSVPSPVIFGRTAYIQRYLPAIQQMRDNESFINVYETMDAQGWLVYDYAARLQNSQRSLKHWLTHVEKADFDDCRLLLTTLLRADRFSEGTWEKAVDRGTVTHLLNQMVMQLSVGADQHVFIQQTNQQFQRFHYSELNKPSHLSIEIDVIVNDKGISVNYFTPERNWLANWAPDPYWISQFSQMNTENWPQQDLRGTTLTTIRWFLGGYRNGHYIRYQAVNSFPPQLDLFRQWLNQKVPPHAPKLPPLNARS
jgi:hypothetical protein